jgi:hypothetical protein
LLADTGSGHNITQNVFIECGSMCRADGLAEIKPDRLFYVLQCSTTRRRLFVLGDLESNSRIDPPVTLDFSPIAPHFSARVAPNNGLTARHQNRL